MGSKSAQQAYSGICFWKNLFIWYRKIRRSKVSLDRKIKIFKYFLILTLYLSQSWTVDKKCGKYFTAYQSRSKEGENPEKKWDFGSCAISALELELKICLYFKKIIIFPGNLFYRKIWKIWPVDRFQSFCYSRTFTKFAALKRFIEPHLRIQGLIFILFVGSVNSYQIFLQKCSRIHFHKYFYEKGILEIKYRIFNPKSTPHVGAV